MSGQLRASVFFYLSLIIVEKNLPTECTVCIYQYELDSDFETK